MKQKGLLINTILEKQTTPYLFPYLCLSTCWLYFIIIILYTFKDIHPNHPSIHRP